MTDLVARRDNLPDLSVIVATRNRATHLARLMDSLAVAVDELDRSIVELIVADNGSTDRTHEVVSCFKESSSFEVKLVKEELAGKARALNRALEIATGVVCAFVDDDIVVERNWAKEVLDAFSTKPDMGVAGGRVEPYDSAAAKATLRTCKNSFRVSWNEFRPDNIPIIGCNVAYRFSLLKSIGGFDQDTGPGSIIGSGDDLDLLYRALEYGALVQYLPQISVLHNHGRTCDEEIAKLRRRYLKGRGAFYHKYASNNHRRVKKWAYWEVRSMLSALFARPWRLRRKLQELADLVALGSGALVSIKVRGLRSTLKRPVR